MSWIEIIAICPKIISYPFTYSIICLLSVLVVQEVSGSNPLGPIARKPRSHTSNWRSGKNRTWLSVITGQRLVNSRSPRFVTRPDDLLLIDINIISDQDLHKPTLVRTDGYLRHKRFPATGLIPVRRRRQRPDPLLQVAIVFAAGQVLLLVEAHPPLMAGRIET
jgi:hypothetical protein